jgi:hypothetical protein
MFFKRSNSLLKCLRRKKGGVGGREGRSWTMMDEKQMRSAATLTSEESTLLPAAAAAVLAAPVSCVCTGEAREAQVELSRAMPLLPG